MNTRDIAGVVLLGLGVCYIAYQSGRSRGNKEGYERAQVQQGQWVCEVTTQSVALQARNVQLSQENGSLHKENDIVKNLLRQQPSTPEAEAILKAVGRVELRLDQFLPPAFEDGEDHSNSLN
jgi:hypothetical protein